MSALRRRAKRKALGWVLLEIFAALAIAVAIVWWTIPRSPKGDHAKDRQDRDEG
jgi:hypothetical protein